MLECQGDHIDDGEKCPRMLGADSHPLTDINILDRLKYLDTYCICLFMVCLCVPFSHMPEEATRRSDHELMWIYGEFIFGLIPLCAGVGGTKVGQCEQVSVVHQMVNITDVRLLD